MYALLVREALGDSFDDHSASGTTTTPRTFRLHRRRPGSSTTGSVEQALRDLVDWVEQGSPPATTDYRWHEEWSRSRSPRAHRSAAASNPSSPAPTEPSARPARRRRRHVRSGRGGSTRNGMLVRAEWDFDGAERGRSSTTPSTVRRRAVLAAQHLRRARRLLPVSTRPRIATVIHARPLPRAQLSRPRRRFLREGHMMQPQRRGAKIAMTTDELDTYLRDARVPSRRSGARTARERVGSSGTEHRSGSTRSRAASDG
jgi:hypothetical protein